MSDPYAVLGEQLLAAARRHEVRPRRPVAGGRRASRARIVILALVILLLGATIALAARGLLAGSPVKPSGRHDPRADEGIPALGGARLLSLRAADPEGGPPWGMRLVRTTRGELCAQVGRVLDGELGELGSDGAFADDGRLHPLPAAALPDNGPQASNVLCVLGGQTFTARSSLDRNAARGLSGADAPAGVARELSFGVLGPNAVDVTYRTPQGLEVEKPTPVTGAYLLVKRGPSGPQGDGYGAGSGFGTPSRRRPGLWGAVSAVTYRFGGRLCSEGIGAAVRATCPPPTPAPSSSILPVRSLHERLRVTLTRRAGSVVGAEVAFTAPYAITNAHEEYEVTEPSPAGCGGAGGEGLPIARDIAKGATVHVDLRSPVALAGSCRAEQEVQVRFINAEGPSPAAPHESVIVGSITLTQPTAGRPRG